jgi:tetratricopeptide (TPR) repeat protein
LKKSSLCVWFFLSFFLFEGRAMAQLGDDALLEYHNKNYLAAVEICQRELQVNQANIDSYVVLGWSLIALGRYGDAETSALMGRGFSRYDARLTEILGEASYFLGKNAVALQYFQEYINLVPEGQRIDIAYYFIGEINIRLGRFSYADIALSTAVHYQPQNVLWWTRLAYARERIGELRTAATAYENALALNANFADARRGLDRVRENLRNR